MRPISITRFADELLELYAPPIRRPSTHRQMRQVLGEFALLEGTKTTSDFTPVAVAKWIQAHPDRTPVTTASHLRAFRAACGYAVIQGYLRKSPFDFRKVNEWVRVEVLAADKPSATKHITEEQVGRVLALVDVEASQGSWESGRLQALVYTYAFTGLRSGEALNLKIQDLDLARKILSIQPRRGWRAKTRKSSARLPLADPLADVLMRWLPRTGCEWVFPGKKLIGPWTSGAPGVKPLDHVKAAGMRAGVPGLTISSFRKTIGTLGKYWGFSQLEMMAWLRHSSVETQRWYDEEDVETLRPAARKIQFRIANSS